MRSVFLKLAGVLFIASSFGAVAQAPSQAWLATFDSGTAISDSTRVIRRMNNGNIIAASQVNSGPRIIRVTRHNGATGAVIWTADLAAPSATTNDTNDMVIDPATGDAYLASPVSVTGQNWYISKVRGSDGVVQWSTMFNGPGNGNDTPRSICITTDGNVVVAGQYTLASGAPSNRVAKYNASTGVQMWAFEPTNEWQDFSQVVADGSGNAIAVGHVNAALLETENGYVVKFNAGGTIVWSQTINGAANDFDTALTVDVDSAGNVYAGVESRVVPGMFTNDDDILVVKLAAATGAEQWRRSITGALAGSDTPYFINLDASDNVYVGGAVFESSDTNTDALLAKLNSATGTVVWSITKTGTSVTGSESFRNIALNGTEVYAASIVENTVSATAQNDIYFGRFNPSNGATLWEVNYNSSGTRNDQISTRRGGALIAGATDTVFVAGQSQNAAGTQPDGVILNYAPAVAVPEVSIAVTPSSVGEDGGTNLTYTVTRSLSIASPTTVNISTGGTATSGSDYIGGVATVVIPANATTATITIDPSVDSNVEANETVILTVAPGAGYTVGAPDSATGTINNDDTDVSVAVSPSSAGEDGANNLTYTFTRTGVIAGALTVNFNVSGSATLANSDYAQTGAATYSDSAGTVSFAAAASTATITVNPTADNIVESDETVILTLAAGSGYNVIAPSVATGTISNDDSTVTLAVAPVSTTEDGVGNLLYTFTRSGGPTSSALTVSFGVSGSATLANSDYAQTGAATYSDSAGSVSIGAGSAAATITVNPTNDTTQEPDETLILTLAANAAPAATGGYSVGASAVATGSILDDDLPLVSVATLNAGDNDAAEGGVNNGIYTFTRNQTSGALVANFQLDVSSTASAVTDFTLSGATSFNSGTGAGTVSFANGVGTVAVTLSALTESPNPAEAAETARLNVVSGIGYGIGSPANATVTIAANSFLVTTIANSGTGSLRQAVDNANTLVGADTITFSDGTGGTVNFTDSTPDTIALSSGQISLASDLTIAGTGADLLIVQNTAPSSATSRVFLVPAGPAKTVQIRGLTMTGGNPTGPGGGLQIANGSNATVSIIACAIRGNSTLSFGAGIHQGTGTLSVLNSTISDNISTEDSGGGGGIDSSGTALTLINSTLSGNSITGSNGGNSGAILAFATTTTIRNCTITNNTGTDGFGGVSRASGTVTVSNSIIAGNVNNTTQPDVGGAFTSGGGNLIGNSGSATGFTNGVNSDQVGSGASPVNPQLAALANNGGRTQTHALLGASSALNAGLNAQIPLDAFDLDGDLNTTEVIDVDQRGVGFTRAVGAVDIGAFELQKAVAIVANAASANEGTGAGTTPFTFTISRSGGTSGAVTMDYAVSGGAVSAADFGGTLPSGQLTIADTFASTTLTINVSRDSTREPDEAFTVTLSNPDNGYIVQTASASSTIVNDDFEADLSISKTDGATTATPGTATTYTITASNAGPDPATGANVIDTFPASLSCTWTCVGANGGSCTANGSGSINQAVNLPSGGSTTFTASCAIAPGATGTLANTATVATPIGITDTVPGNNSATDSNTLTPSANLGISKTDGASAEVPGTPVTYTIIASNAGPSNVSNATVADTFPAVCSGATWSCAGAGGGICLSGSSGSGNLNEPLDLPAGGSVTYTATCNISAAATGTLENTATVSSAVSDPGSGNNSATDTNSLVPQADLSISKTDGQTSVNAGTNTTYTITASNAGPSNAPGTTLADTFPAACTSVTWTCAGAGGGICTANGSGNINDTVNLPSGGSVAFSAICAISTTATGTLSNTATVTLAGGINDPTPGNNSATDNSTIVEVPVLSINSVGLTEGDSGSSDLAFTVTRTTTGTAFSVDYATADGSAAAGSDYTTTTGTLNFTANGAPTQTISVPITGDNRVEVSESFTLSLSNATGNAQIGTGSGTGTITDNDSAVVNFNPTSVSQSEGSGPMAFTVTLSNPVQSGVTLTVNTANGTAGAADFTAISNGAVSFAANSTTPQTVNVTLNNDALDEDDETFSLTLSGLTATGNVTLASAAPTLTANATIVDDDATPTLTISSPSQNEGNSGSAPMNFTVNLSAASGRTVSFTAATANGSASAPSDYVALVATPLTIPAGQSSLTIPVTINGDAGFEGNETFSVNLTSISNATPGTLSGTGTILEDDQQPTTTTINSDLPDPSVVGQAYPVAVTVTAQSSSPTGSVTVSDGTASCTATLSSGATPTSTASCNLTSTTAGAKTLTASYTAATSDFGNSSGTTGHQVNPAATTISVSGPARSRINQPTAFSFALTVTSPGGGTPTGTVTLSSGATSCTATLPTTSCNLSFTTLGSRTVTASYAGDGNYLASISSGAGNMQTLVFAQSNMDVSKNSAGSTFRPGELLVYTVQVRNLGPDAAQGIRVRDQIPAGLSNTVWSCDASGGVACPVTGGSGDLDTTTGAYPVGGLLTFTFYGTAQNVQQILNQALIELPADTTVEDPATSNNNASDLDQNESIFRDGLEDPLVNTTSGAYRLPGLALRSVVDEVAAQVYRLDDVRGTALQIYARQFDGQMQYALALRGPNGFLSLSAWQTLEGEPLLQWTATPEQDGYHLQSATLR